jgi:CRISPR/Cas system-associated exonuclease Cas4 (RecB family)
MPDNIYISASMLKDYLECPRRVYYRINSPDTSTQTPEMIVGSIIHSAIEKYWNDREGAFKYALAQYIENNLDIQYIDKATLCLSNFFDYFYALVSDGDLIEFKFRLPFGSAFLVGKMDRVTENGIIIDWKTSTTHKNDITKDPQFILYHYVYEQIYKTAPNSVVKANLIDGSINTYTRDKVLEGSIINTVIPEVIESIRSGSLAPTGLYTGKCHRCQSKAACYRDIGY